MKKRVGVVFGGRSGEHEISIRSAKAVIENIDREKYEIVPLAIGPTGNWLPPEAAIKLLPESTAAFLPAGPLSGHEGPVAMIGDTKFKGITAFAEPSTEAYTTPVDIVFPVLHGTYGEDGTIQGLFEMADIPYVGCGVLASATGMDKCTAKMLFQARGLRASAWRGVTRREWRTNRDGVIASLEQTLPYPVFVKPANLGSS